MQRQFVAGFAPNARSAHGANPRAVGAVDGQTDGADVPFVDRLVVARADGAHMLGGRLGARLERFRSYFRRGKMKQQRLDEFALRAAEGSGNVNAAGPVAERQERGCRLRRRERNDADPRFPGRPAAVRQRH